MIQWLLCHLFGHKVVYESFTSDYADEETIQDITDNLKTTVIKIPTRLADLEGKFKIIVYSMEYVKSPFCLRCGKPIKEGKYVG